jgi:hypothetical protein
MAVADTTAGEFQSLLRRFAEDKHGKRHDDEASSECVYAGFVHYDLKKGEACFRMGDLMHYLERRNRWFLWKKPRVLMELKNVFKAREVRLAQKRGDSDGRRALAHAVPLALLGIEPEPEQITQSAGDVL